MVLYSTLISAAQDELNKTHLKLYVHFLRLSFLDPCQSPNQQHGKGSKLLLGLGYRCTVVVSLQSCFSTSSFAVLISHKLYFTMLCGASKCLLWDDH